MREFHSGNNSVVQTEWEWPISPTQQKHSERVTLLRPIPYELTTLATESPGKAVQGRALSVNISTGGMLLLMDTAPALEQVMKVYVPTPVAEAETPTLAEVRWMRKLPFASSKHGDSYFVGLKFLF